MNAVKKFQGRAERVRARGWAKRGLMLPVHTEVRLLAAPATYDEENRTVLVVISVGSPVQRPYGTEVLRISPSAVILTRLAKGGIPLLDSHQQVGLVHALGRVTSAWVSDGKLMGKLAFNATPEGRKAEGMVVRGEIGGVSAGYRVLDWEIRNQDGDIIDPARDRIQFDDDLTFTAVRWELLECSPVTVPADNLASVRFDAGLADQALPRSVIDRLDLLAGMRVRQAMYDRQAAAAEKNRALADVIARMKTRARMVARAMRAS